MGIGLKKGNRKIAYSAWKRAFDLLLGALLLLVVSPLMLLLALLIKKEDGDPVFYRGERVGRGGKPFRMIKFRSMVTDADKIGGSSTANDDPRMTNRGKLLRKYKLDELPQVFNVIKGDMSFVGPRPEVKQYTDMLQGEEREILSVRPGITDWASIWNSDEGSLLAGAEDPDRFYEEMIRPQKIRLQLKYVRERSVVTDLKILFKTAETVVTRKKSDLAMELE